MGDKITHDMLAEIIENIKHCVDCGGHVYTDELRTFTSLGSNQYDASAVLCPRCTHKRVKAQPEETNPITLTERE